MPLTAETDQKLKIDAKRTKSRIKAVKVDANKRVIPKGSTEKPRYWLVNLGKKLTGTTKQRRYFDTEKLALDFIDRLGGTMRRKGGAAFSISDALAHEAVALSKELEPHKVSLTYAVRFFIKNAPKLDNVKVSQVIPTYLASKQDDRYRKAQAISLGVFAREFGNKTISSIFPNSLQNWFEKQGWEPLNQRNYMRDMSMFFRWCKFNDYCVSSPMDKVIRPRVTTKTPPIYSVEEAQKLLKTAKDHPELKLMEFVGFAFYSGIRVEEMGKIDWEMIAWNQNEICLPETITKTNRPRLIPMSEAFKAWIAPVAKPSGPLFDKTNLRTRKDRLFDLVGFKSKRNAFRHTFASYHAAHHRNFTELQMILGQRTPSVLLTHYVTATRREDAARFFELRP